MEPETSRRGALITLAGGIASLVSCTSPPEPNVDAGKLDEQLDNDLTRLGARTYSDEGIPVFLVCEDLAPGTTVRHSQRKPLNPALADAFRKYAEILPRIRPHATEDDVPKLVEVLAERDFGTLSKSKRR